MISAGVNGAITWVDLSTPDVASAVKFYRELLGWTDVEESDTPTGRYYIGKVGERRVGGLMGHGPELVGSPAMWTTFIYVDDIEATLAKVADVGGTILEKPFDIPGGAQIAVVTDPTGAMFGLFAGPEIDGALYSQDPGRVCWVELLTRDPAAAKTFYAEVLGWKAETDDSGGAAYSLFTMDDEMVAGMMLMPEGVPAEAPAYWGVYFTVADCPGAVARASLLGGRVLAPTMAQEMGSFAVLADPQGGTFNIMEYAK